MMAASDSRGFTLLEVLVAFALLGTAAVLLLGLLAQGLRDVAAAERVGEAALHARSLLDNAGRMERLQPGRSSGSLEGGRYQWTLEVREVADPWPQAGGAAPPAAAAGALEPFPIAEPVLYRLELELRWGEGERQRLRVATLRALYPLPEPG